MFSVTLGSFQKDKDHPAARFLRVANTMEEDMTSSDCGKFDWPRYTLSSVYPVLFIVILWIFTDKIHPDTETKNIFCSIPVQSGFEGEPQGCALHLRACNS